MNPSSADSRTPIRWLAFVAAFGLLLVLLFLPPPASTVALVICLLVGLYFTLQRAGYQPIMYPALAGRLLRSAITPFLAVAGAFVQVNRASVGARHVLPLPMTMPLTRLRIAAEMGVIVLMVLFATSRFYDTGLGLQLSGGETEWITSSAYAAADGLRTYGRIPLWQPYLEFGEPLIDNPVTFVLNPISTVPSLVIGAVNGLKISVILSVLVAGMGGWLLGWTLGLGALGRLLLALLLVGKGGMSAMFNTGYFQLASSQAYFPWIIAGTVGIFRLPNKRWPVVALALGSTLLLFAGNVWFTLPMAICVVVVAGAYLIRRFPVDSVGVSRISLPLLSTQHLALSTAFFPTLSRLLLAAVLTLGISAVLLLPLGANQDRLNRHPPEREAGWVTPLFRYAIPFYFNPDPFQKLEFFDPTNQKWQDWWHIDELAETYYSFVSPVWFLALLFIVIPLYRPRWNRLWWAAWGLLIFFTLWGAGGQPLFLWLYQNVSLIRGWRFVGRAFAVGAFWIAVLLAIRADSLWSIIRSTNWAQTGLNPALARRLPVFLSAVLIVGSGLAAYQVNREWINSPNNVVTPMHSDDKCVRWLRAQYPNRELTIWRWGYEGVTTLMNNHARIYDVLADFEMSPVPSTIGYGGDLTRSLPEFAILASEVEHDFMLIQGYRPMPGSPNFPNTPAACLYRKRDALTYIYTVPMDTVINAKTPSLDMYDQLFVTLPPASTAPITTYLRQPDNILVRVEGDLLENRLLTIQERAFPGWRVTVDGLPAKLESVGGQIGVLLPRDRSQHTIYFEYRPRLLVLGGWITLAASVFSILYLLRADHFIRRVRTRRAA
jgi:hypothetical protein